MAAVTVIDGVTGDVQFAAVGSQHILGGIGFGQSGHRIGSQGSAIGGRTRCGRCGVIHLVISDRRNRQRSGINGSCC